MTTRPRARDVELAHAPPYSSASREAATISILQAVVGERRSRPRRAPRLLVEPARDEPPRLAVVGHVEVAVAVAPPACELRRRRSSSTGIRGSASWASSDVAERAQRRAPRARRRSGSAARSRRGRARPSRVTSSQCAGLREHVEVGVAAVQLRRRPAALARQAGAGRRAPARRGASAGGRRGGSPRSRSSLALDDRGEQPERADQAERAGREQRRAHHEVVGRLAEAARPLARRRGGA